MKETLAYYTYFADVVRPHDGWLDISKPYIAAFKDGAKSAAKYITSDELVYWYRPAPRDVNCDATDTCMVPANNGSGNYFMGRPDGWQSMQDAIFIVSLLQSPATVQVNSGETLYQYDAPAGAFAQQVPMQVGTPSFTVLRNGNQVLSGTSLKPIINGCVCGLYNFNAYVGTLPLEFNDPLQADGLAAFNQGLKVQTCQATPSLGTVPPASTAPTTTSMIGSTSPSSPPTTTPPTSLPPTPPPTPPTGCPTTCPTAGGGYTITSTTTTTQFNTVTVTQTLPCTPTGGGGGSGSSGGNVCTGGTGPGNYVGLCNFCCRYGYCPPGPCTCTQYGASIPAPPSTGWHGAPLPGGNNSYLGLCSFACDHGYCPSTACRIV
ncbi:unnamed protein product [Penicillium pancosmium]